MRKRRLLSLLFNFYIVFTTFSLVFATEVAVPKEVKETLENITKILLLIGSAVCIAKVIQIGIMFLTASAAEKSHAKEAILPWIIGTIVCFGAATIGNAVIKIFTESALPSTVLGY